MPIKTETNGKTQVINISISATSTNQPKTNMAFVVIRTGFSADIHSALDEMVPGSNVDLRNAKDFRSEEFITKEINTDKYYHLGLALGLSYQTLDSIQFRSRQHEEAGVYTPNQKAVIFMIRYWKCLQHSVSLADDHLRNVWKSVSESGGSAPVLNQQRRGEKKHDKNVEEVFEGEFPREEPRTTPTVGLHDLEVEIPEARGRWEERLRHKRTNTPSVRSDSLSSFSTVLEEEEGRFPQHYLGKFFKPLSFEMSFDNFFQFDASMSAMTLPSVAHACSAASHQFQSIDEHREDEEVEHSKQAVLEWMKSGEGVKTADFTPQEYTTQPTDEEGHKTESVHHMSPPSSRQDETPVENIESREDLGGDTVMIRLEKHGIEVRIPPNEAYRAKDVTVEPIHNIPTKEENNTGITKTSLGDAVSTSSRLSQSTSVDIPVQDAPAAAREVSTSTERGPSIDVRHEDEDKYHSEGIFDQTGGELHIPSYGLTLSIPPGALPDGSGETITLDVLTDVPPEITLRHDETLVTYGFRCLPSGLQFASEKPVRLKIPHCVNLIDPKKVQVVLYSMNHGGEDDRIVQTSRTCRVTYNHVEICLEHFSNGILAFIKDWFSMRDKRMSFMPFLPKIMPESREPTLQFRMVTKPHGNSWRDVHDIGKEADYQPAKDEDDEMNVKEDDMEVTCQLSDNDILTEIVPARFIDKTKHTVYFELDFKRKADDLLVKLKVIQSNLPMDIKFRTRFVGSRGITETSPGKTDSASPRPSASTQVDIPPQGAPTSASKVSTSKARPTKESREQDFDDFLKKVAKQTDKDTDIDNLGKELGFKPAEITRYMQTNEKYHTVTYMGTLSMLRDWRNRTTEPKEREELKKALIASNHHRLADNLLNDDMAKS